MEFPSLSHGAQKIKIFGSQFADDAGKKVDAAIDCLTDFKTSLHRVSKDGWTQIERRTKKEPFTALVIATGAGLVVGWLIGREGRG